MNLRLKYISFLALYIGLFFMSGCTDERERLLGDWKQDESVLSFKKDGSWVWRNPAEPIELWGTYEIMDSGKEIKMNYGNPPYPEIRIVEKFAITNDDKFYMKPLSWIGLVDKSELSKDKLTMSIYGQENCIFIKN